MDTPEPPKEEKRDLTHEHMRYDGTQNWWEAPWFKEWKRLAKGT